MVKAFAFIEKSVSLDISNFHLFCSVVQVSCVKLSCHGIVSISQNIALCSLISGNCFVWFPASLLKMFRGSEFLPLIHRFVSQTSY
ncbi:hypothetical protein SLEP1_g33519 [Rubroshorea leprosula]|uniref:Uncharacterized protein n=1 Tax=Rubroshorea leprosula TaxID=152421 RepID=A0AAV5KGV7_9ROSI|nr:hypothetical protein SLEP1_g33519 [Rubroshorea leprosula]